MHTEKKICMVCGHKCLPSACGRFQGRNTYTRGLCQPCYAVAYKAGTLDVVGLPPKKWGNPIGYVNMTDSGYLTVKTAAGTIGEHVYVMEQHLGRKLVTGENVHHKNGVRHDNRISNLELWRVPQPAGQRLTDLLDYVVEIHGDVLRERLALT